MLQIDNISKSYGGEVLLDGVAFSMLKGEKCGLVGRNGSGKTTLLRLITGEETVDGGSIVQAKHTTIGYLSQHVNFTAPTVLDEAAKGLRHQSPEHLYQAEKILFGLGFQQELLEKSPQDLSGGYQLRLHLAKVLISDPDFLLLDEPTNYLDIVSMRWLTRFLQQWKGGLLLISNDREFMDTVTTHMVAIHRKKVRKVQGGTADVYAQILQDEEVYEKTRINLDKKRAHAEAFVERFGAKASKAVQAQSRVKAIQRMPVLDKLANLYNLEFTFPYAPFSSKKLLNAEYLSFSYTDDPLIRDLSLTISPQERLAVIGKNGRGKSTILRLIARELAPQEGQIKSSEQVVIGYFGQTNIQRLHPDMTIEEEISAANPKLQTREVRSICGAMMFSGDKALKPIRVLSGGEKSRVLLGKILAKPCNLLLLDEPTHHLDIESIEALMDAIEDFPGAVVLVTHSELILKRMATTQLVVCQADQQKVLQGIYEDFLERGGWTEEEGVNTSKRKSEPDYWKAKQQRTDMVAERSRKLKPLEKALERLEQKIVALEKLIDEQHQELVILSQEGNGNAIQKLSIEIAEQSGRLDQLYADFESTSNQIDALQADFSKRFDDLKADD